MVLRKHNRYRLELPVTFLWRDSLGLLEQHLGFTRDLSLGGAFIYATALPPSGANLKFKAVLPTDLQALRAALHGQGRVVRAEPARGTHRAGFAVAIDKKIVLRGARAPRQAAPSASAA